MGFERKYVYNPGDCVGELTVTRYLGGGKYEAHCSCGKTVQPLGRHLSRGLKSCGHVQRTAGGKSRTAEYQAHYSMLDRCMNPSHDSWEHYGGRGITVCDEWRNGGYVDGVWQSGFDLFYAHVGPRPGAGYSLGRLNNDGHYVPGNVAWQTATDQARNRRNNRKLAHGGVTKCLVEWGAELDVAPESLARRIDRGWDPETALSAPKLSKLRSLEVYTKNKQLESRVAALESIAAAKDAEITELKATIARLTAGQ